MGQLEVGTNWHFEVRYVRDKNISGFKNAMQSTSSVDRWNGAMYYSENINVKKYPYRDNLYYMVLPTDLTYWKSLLGEWGFKSFMTGPPGAPSVGHDQVHDAFDERWKYESGVPIIIP